MSISLTHRTTLLVLAAILLLAFGLRLYRSSAYGIFFDEKSTLLISQGVVLEGANQHDVFDKKDSPYFTPQEFWKPKTMADFIEANIRGDIGNSPAYYGLLWLWMKVFGLSDFSMRFPSVLFSTLVVFLVYVFVKRHFKSENLALMSSLIAAIEPFFIASSHIARNYSMTFCLTLLATHVFLIILEKEAARQRPTGLYVGYCLLVATSLLSHYLALTVFLAHGLYALFYVRTLRIWLSLAGCAGVALGLVSLWFVYGGGAYTFFSLDHQAKFYRNIALTNPYNSGFGIVLPATLANVFWRALPVFSDLVIFTNGLANPNAVIGYRNFALAVLLGLLITVLIHRYRSQRQPPAWVQFAVPLLLVAGLPLYSINKLQHLVLSAALPLFYVLVTTLIEDTDRKNRPYVVFLIILSLVPLFFLLVMAFRSGHTYGITQRYSGFSFPYVVILTAMMIRKLVTLRPWFSLPLAAALLIQLGFIGLLLQRIYNDVDPKYTSFGATRQANPFWTSAQKIQELYAPGDTILYPSMKRPEYTEIDKTGRPYDIIDAQLVNIYLPKEATYYQRIDPDEPDKIVLVKGRTGQKITIFDLEGTKYRY